MRKLKSIYKILRSIVMTVVVSVAVLYVSLYILLSVPSIQEKIKSEIVSECSRLIGGEIKVESLSISPFNEVVLRHVSLFSPSGVRCAGIDKVSAGIDLWQFISSRRIIINYALISGLDADIVQQSKDGPLNIQFLIDALSPKDRNKPPAKFDLRFRNVVIRDSKARFDRPWIVDSVGVDSRFASLRLSDLKMDLSIPRLSNTEFVFDVRDLHFIFNDKMNLRHLGGKITYLKSDPESHGVAGCDRLLVEGLNIDLPASHLESDSLEYDFDSETPLHINIEGFVTPSDLQSLYAGLGGFRSKWDFIIDSSVSPADLKIDNLYLVDTRDGSRMQLEGYISGFSHANDIRIDVGNMDAVFSSGLISDVLRLVNVNDSKFNGLIEKAGYVSLKGNGSLSLPEETLESSMAFKSLLGDIDLQASVSDFKSVEAMKTSVIIGANDLDIGVILGKHSFGKTSFFAEAELEGRDKNSSGKVDLHMDYLSINNLFLSNLEVSADKKENLLTFSIDANDDKLMLTGDGNCDIGDDPGLTADIVVARLLPDLFLSKSPLRGSEMSFAVSADLAGHGADDLTGSIDLTDLLIKKGADSERLYLPGMFLTAVEKDDTDATHGRLIRLESDWLEAEMEGDIVISSLASEAKSMLAEVLPSLFQGASSHDLHSASNDFAFKVKIPGVGAPYDFFNLPFRPLSDIEIAGKFNSELGVAALKLDARHLQQGKNKLIRETSVSFDLDTSASKADLRAATIYPAKKGDVQLAVNVDCFDDVLKTNLIFNPTLESSLKGDMGLIARFSRIPAFDKSLVAASDNALSVDVNILPSTIEMRGTKWNVSDGHIDYSGKKINVSNFKIQHGNQFVKIDGKVSENSSDKVSVRLNEIDLDYIFGMLNINYVTFGGMASGEVVGSRLLTSAPDAHTKFLNVRNLSYNGAVLGNGNLAADYDAAQKAVDIYAVIQDPLSGKRRARIDGGIWVTRDSLSFSFDADKVNLAFMKPFVSAFCSDLKGKGSGKCKLYGTFSDIDLVGGLYADTLAMKLDFTNTWYYAGGDSVRMGKGLIDVPPLTLYDKYGNSAEFSGWLRHRYFHEPVFDFKIRDAKGILCYDTNEHINPLWYGTIFGQGNGQVTGRPGLVEINMDMTTRKGSTFTYVISDSEEFDEYSFLTFTDRRKIIEESEKPDTVPQYLRQFMKQKQDDNSGSSEVVLNLRGSVTPDALVTIVMDPKGGDKISARGAGGLQMDYTSADNSLRMFGKYVLEEGNYNFTLQDIIIKNFIIRQGSTISFNGDPMDANLDIAATYRVNTNLTDLDKSFASDKELNRTNVPVDALLMVTGPMTQPDINFDIELPTLTSDVERKVKSIVSTNDMMSRQIIYLLALNRFYTPEYTGNSSSGAEWSSMASSTISSQLSNMLSQMTDKLSVAPSFRSDKGDFTDMEFDLALSSRLLNNRLLINGNFGYRDRNTSTTQFVGDFDIEYLLNRNGNLRLKAYNHFNDQNYYLRSALTTQGVGVLYRWDFDRLLKNKRFLSPVSSPNDTIVPIANDSLQINYGVSK